MRPDPVAPIEDDYEPDPRRWKALYAGAQQDGAAALRAGLLVILAFVVAALVAAILDLRRTRTPVPSGR